MVALSVRVRATVELATLSASKVKLEASRTLSAGQVLERVMCRAGSALASSARASDVKARVCMSVLEERVTIEAQSEGVKEQQA